MTIKDEMVSGGMASVWRSTASFVRKVAVFLAFLLGTKVCWADFTCSVVIGEGEVGQSRAAVVSYTGGGSDAPLVRIEAGEGAYVRFSEADAWTKQVEFLALGGEGSQTIFCMADSVETTLELSHTFGGSGQIPWETLGEALRPSYVNADAWRYAEKELEGRLGTTWSDYLARLRANAAYLAGRGRETCRTDRLLSLEISRALGINAVVPILASSTDLVRPARGLPLLYTRSFPSALYTRFDCGVLGYGWKDNYSVQAELTDDTTLLFRLPTGGVYQFSKTTGDWQPDDARDRTVLTETSADYILTAENGTVLTFSKANMRLKDISDRDGNSLTLVWEGTCLQSVTHSDGPWLKFAYTADGRLESVGDDLGHMVKYAYNGQSMLVSMTGTDGLKTLYGYRDSSADLQTCTARALTSITRPDQATRRFEYDAVARLTAISDNAEGIFRFAYSDVATVTITAPDGGVTQVDMGASGEVLRTEDALGGIVGRSYDGDGLLKSTTAPSGRMNGYAHDAYGRVTAHMSASGQVTAFDYTELFGNLKTLRDARGNAMAYDHDDKGRVTAIQFPDGSKMLVEYNAHGDVQRTTNCRGQTETYTYDAEGRVASRTWENGRTFAYGYDGKGRLVTASDSETGDVAIQYDDADRMIRISYPDERGFSFAYDTCGRMVERRSFDGSAECFAYDDAGRIVEVTDGEGVPYLFNTYDETTGRLTSREYGNGARTDYRYDLLGRTVSIEHLDALGNIAESLQYCYDADGRCIRASSLLGEERYGYDVAGQLTNVEYPVGTGESFSYDAVGNRTTANGVGYTANALNQYTKIGTVDYTYDADGNMTGKTEDGSTTTYVYDQQNRLVAVRNAEKGLDWSCTYDVLGNRVAVTENGVTTRRVVLPGTLPSVAAEYRDGVLVKRHVVVDALQVAEIDAVGGEHYYHGDLIGSTRLVTDESGVPGSRLSYKSFGTVRSAVGDIPTAGYVGTFGVETDSTGLLFMRNRYYDPRQGRFIQRDPIGLSGGDVNWYRYCGNNPILLVDPNGLLSLSGFGTHFKKEIWPHMEVGFKAGLYVFTPLIKKVNPIVGSFLTFGVDLWVLGNEDSELAGDIVDMDTAIIEASFNNMGSPTPGWYTKGMGVLGDIDAVIRSGQALSSMLKHIAASWKTLDDNTSESIILRSYERGTTGTGNGMIMSWEDWAKIWDGGAGSGATYSLGQSLSHPWGKIVRADGSIEMGYVIMKEFSGTLEGNGFGIGYCPRKLPFFENAVGATFNNVKGITILNARDCVFNNCDVCIYEDNGSTFNNCRVYVKDVFFWDYFSDNGIDWHNDKNVIGSTSFSTFSSCECSIELAYFSYFSDSSVDINGALECYFLCCSGNIEIMQDSIVDQSPKLSINETIDTSSQSLVLCGTDVNVEAVNTSSTEIQHSQIALETGGLQVTSPRLYCYERYVVVRGRDYSFEVSADGGEALAVSGLPAGFTFADGYVTGRAVATSTREVTVSASGPGGRTAKIVAFEVIDGPEDFDEQIEDAQTRVEPAATVDEALGVPGLVWWPFDPDKGGYGLMIDHDWTWDGNGSVRTDAQAFDDEHDCGFSFTVTGPTQMKFRYAKLYSVASFYVSTPNEHLYRDFDEGDGTEWKQVVVDIPAGRQKVFFWLRPGYCWDNWENDDNGLWIDGLEFGDFDECELTYPIYYETSGASIYRSFPWSYTADDLPLSLDDVIPVPRDGYEFTGWSLNGEMVTKIPEGTTGEITLTALWRRTFAEEYATGKAFEPFTLELGDGGTTGMKVTGLPAGLKFTAKALKVRDPKTKKTISYPANTIYGTPTKSGIYTVVARATTAGGRTITERWTFVVRRAGERVVRTACETARGTVSGRGTYAKGKKATLKAIAKKGYVFAGWELEGASLPKGADPLNPVLTITVGAADITARAKFIPVSEDWAAVGVAAGSATFAEEYTTGGAFTPVTLAFAGGSRATVKVSGFPAGLKFTAKALKVRDPKAKRTTAYPANTVYGTPTKSGIYTVAAKAATAGGKTATARWTFTVRRAGERAVRTACDAARGAVSGRGVYAKGKKATLKATARKGYVFSGWELEGADLPKGLDARNPVLAFTPGAADVTATARFAPASDDRTLALLVDGVAVAADGSTRLVSGRTGFTLSVESISLPKLVLSGLPAGLKFNAATGRLAGRGTKPGLYTVTAKLSNATVRRAVARRFRVEVPNFTAANALLRDGLANAPGEVYSAYVGVRDFGAPSLVPTDAARAKTMKVTGLPTGLRFDAKRAARGLAALAGVPAKAGTYVVKVAVGGKTSTFTLKVRALPSWAVGTFTGCFDETDADGTALRGTAAFTVSAAGKVSAKLVRQDGKAVSWTHACLDRAEADAAGGVSFRVDAVVGGFRCEVSISAAAREGGPAQGVLAGTRRSVDAEDAGEGVVGLAFDCVQNLWGRGKALEGLAAKLKGRKVALPTIQDEQGNTYDVSLAFGAGGAVTAKYRLNGGAAQSASGTLAYRGAGELEAGGEEEDGEGKTEQVAGSSVSLYLNLVRGGRAFLEVGLLVDGEGVVHWVDGRVAGDGEP